MARYTQNYIVAVEHCLIRDVIAHVLSSCNLSVIYVANDYIMAQEKSSKTSFSKLVTVEVLIHQPSADSGSTKLTCITKNGELPLRLGNHCQEMFEIVDQAFNLNSTWKILESSSV
jgi:hypothetical protein